MYSKHGGGIRRGAMWGGLLGLVSLLLLGIYWYSVYRNASADYLRSESLEIMWIGAWLLGYPTSWIAEILDSTALWWLAYPLLFLSPILNMALVGAFIGWGASALGSLRRSVGGSHDV